MNNNEEDCDNNHNCDETSTPRKRVSKPKIYECEYPDCDAAYRGESSKNLYTRNLQHQYNYRGGEKSSAKIKEKSFMYQHQQDKHDGGPALFKQSVLRSYKDCLSRQAAEGVFISKMEGEILNSKSEFHQPSIVTVRREINRGL